MSSDSTSCPDCRNREIRRRRRSNITLFLVSLLGKWPYHCEECGSDFLLAKRYVRPRDREGHLITSSPGRAVRVKAADPNTSGATKD